MLFGVAGVVLVTLAAISGSGVIGDAGAWIKNLFALKM
jgi:hypothetical protein